MPASALAPTRNSTVSENKACQTAEEVQTTAAHRTTTPHRSTTSRMIVENYLVVFCLSCSISAQG